MKDWVWITTGLAVVLVGGEEVAAVPLAFDLSGGGAGAESSETVSVLPADGLSFELPTVPVPPPPSPHPADTADPAVLLAVPSVPPPVGADSGKLPPPPGRNPLPLRAQDVETPEWNALFTGGQHSLVARAVGSAEGTRTAAGAFTAAYYGHRDPGNGVWNQGTFSYQHGADSAAEADAKQLARLRRQAQTLHTQAAAKGMALSKSEMLNGIDLANQAPVTALEWGYIDRLHQARGMGLRGDEAILWARTRAFLDPDSGRWNAPGLGNTVQSISRDQKRRMDAIATALAATPTVSSP